MHKPPHSWPIDVCRLRGVNQRKSAASNRALCNPRTSTKHHAASCCYATCLVCLIGACNHLSLVSVCAISPSASANLLPSVSPLCCGGGDGCCGGGEQYERAIAERDDICETILRLRCPNRECRVEVEAGNENWDQIYTPNVSE